MCGELYDSLLSFAILILFVIIFNFRFTEVYVDELKDTTDLKILVSHYLQHGDVTPKLIDGIVR